MNGQAKKKLRKASMAYCRENGIDFAPVLWRLIKRTFQLTPRPERERIFKNIHIIIKPNI